MATLDEPLVLPRSSRPLPDLRKVAGHGAGMIAEVHRRAALVAGAQIVAVLASTPVSTARAAARWAGKHVVCEKPLGVDLAQASEMAVAARSAGLVAAVPFDDRYQPLVREIRARVRRGALSTVHLVHGLYLQDWFLPRRATSWRVDAGQGGASRACADIGSHRVDLVEWVTGHRITSPSATTSIAVDERPRASGTSFSRSTDGAPARVSTQDAASLLLRTDHGAIGGCVVSQVSAARRKRLWFEIHGGHQSAVFDPESPENVWLGGLERSQVVVRDPGAGSPEAQRLSILPADHVRGYARCFEAFVADAHEAVRRSKAGETAA